MAMTGDHRVLIVGSLEVFFGCKLLVTGGLLWSILRDGFTGVTRHPALWPTVLILGSLALLQLFVMVGVARREDLARWVGGGVCIAGGSVGLVLVVFSPLTLLAGGLVFVLVPGLVLLLLNAFAFALLASDAVRDWCDEPPDDPRPTLAKVGRGGGSIGRAAASAALGCVAGGGALAVVLSVIGAAV